MEGKCGKRRRRVSNGSDEAKFVIFSFFIAIIYGLVKLIKKIFRRLAGGSGGKEREGKKKEGQTGRPFFIKSLTRRRRLDITRKHDNILSGKLGKKLDRHRKGMFGR